MSTILTASNELELNQAIATVDSTSASGDYIIRLTSNITLGSYGGSRTVTYDSQTLSAPDELYAVNLHNGATLTLDGQSHSIDGASKYRGVFDYSGAVTLQNLTIQNTRALGGEGYDGGGGGAGLGGGLYVANDSAHAVAGNVTLDNVIFNNNNATGGTINHSTAPHGTSGAGGGLGGFNSTTDGHGIGEDGGAGNGGGGIGSTANGGLQGNSGGVGIILGASSAGAGATFNGSAGGSGGAYGGGGGATNFDGSSGVVVEKAGGGGGIGGQNAVSSSVGGAGGYGGGGGAGAAGGFGGGGGEGGGASNSSATGGNGGWGGGGGANGGLGGFGAGNGSTANTYTGGGGLAAGGAIFVQQGASLTYKGGSITNGSVTRSGNYATAGQAYGAGIFLQGDETITFAPAAGQTLTISSEITDEYSNGGTGKGSISITGAGTVQLGNNVRIGGTVGVGAGATLSAKNVDNNSHVTNLGTVGLTIDGGTLKNDTGGYAIVVNPSIVTGSGGATIDANGNAFRLTAALSGSGPLVFKSTGQSASIGLGADNHNFTGTTTVNSGATLEADAAAAFSTASAFTVNGLLNLNGFSQTIKSLSGNGSVYSNGGAATLTDGSDGSSTTFSGGFGGVHLTKTGTGTLTLTGDTSSFTGGLTISQGTVAFADANDTVTVSGSIDGSGILRKQGGGTLILTGSNTHNGNTVIEAGLLAVEGTDVSHIYVNAGANLTGAGTLGDVTVLSGGGFNPGSSNSSGQVGNTTTGTLVMASGALLNEQINGRAAGTFDTITVHGGVDISGAIFKPLTTNGFLNSIVVGDSFKIIDNDGSDAVGGMFGNANSSNEILVALNSNFYPNTTAFSVNTHGGDGNDVVITMVNTQANIYQVPGAQTIESGAHLAFTGSKQINFADADQGQVLTATLSASHGTLTDSGNNFVTVSGSNTGTVTVSGSAYDVSTALHNLVYTSAAGYGGSDALSISIHDNSGASNDTATSSVAITVTGGVTPSGHVVATDLNADGRSDILWQNDSGQPAAWTMSGFNQTAGGLVGSNPGKDWHIVGSGDFSGDGKADILWQNDSGQLAVYTMDGVQRTDGTLLGGNPGTEWHVKAVGDFNGDGIADVAWQNDGGQLAIWLTKNLGVQQGALVDGNPGPSWHVVGAGDFSGDGKSDLLWQNDNGQLAIYVMDGVQRTGGVFLGGNPGSDWHARAVGDFNGEGIADVAWQNNSGQAAVWLTHDLGVIDGSLVGGNPGSDWHLKKAGDFNGDGKSDFLWQNDDGSAVIWQMDGHTVTASSYVAHPGADWHIMA